MTAILHVSVGTALRKPKRSQLSDCRCFARCDLLDQIDDAAPKLGVGDARECAGQRQTFRGREEIGNVGRRRAFAEAIRVDGATGPPSNRNETGT